MTGGTLAWGITFAVLCVLTGVTIGWPIGYARGLRHAAEDARDAADAAVVTSWKELPDEDARPAPPWPDAPPQAPRTGPGKHRHPSGPPRHAALPTAGYLPAPGPWDGTLTMPAPAQAPPPWDTPPEPQTQVLEPTAVLPGIPETDTAWTRRNCAELQAYIDQLIAQSGPALKEITS